MKVIDFDEKIIEISVADTGFGISEEKLKKIISLLDNPTIQSNVTIGNTGICLGLTISQNIALRLGPNNSKGIQVAETSVSKGTRFTVLIQDLSYSDENIQNYPDINPDLKMSKELQKAISSRFDERLLNSFIKTDFKPQTKRKMFKEMWPEQFANSLESADVRKESQQLFLNNSLDECLSSLQAEDANNKIGKITKWSNNRKIDLEPKQPKIKQILIVDDDCFNLNVLEALLKRLKCESIKAINGQEAIDKLIGIYHNNQSESMNLNESFNLNDQQQEVIELQLIIMDYQMPILDGVEATQIIISMMEKGELPEIPIIACTAFGGKDEYEKLLNVGMKDVLLKPVKIEKLQFMIDKWSN